MKTVISFYRTDRSIVLNKRSNFVSYNRQCIGRRWAIMRRVPFSTDQFTWATLSTLLFI